MFSIETERLRLRLFQPEDAPIYFATMHNDADVMQYITGTPLPIERTRQAIERYRAHHEQHDFSVWAVTDKENGTFLGHGGLITLPTGKDVEIDYGFGRSYWGKGYATEVARAVFRYGLEDMGLGSIYALAFPANVASQRVMQKMGMRYQGRSSQFYNLELETYTIAQGELDTTGMLYRVTH
jgi:ribosomal-protein-alanine N-acetyltransferase